jgi:berberine-like enzyme
VLRDGLDADRERRGQLADRRLAVGEPVEDRPPGRVGEGGEGPVANYMQADEPLERVRAAFGDESFERLRAVKSRYDPDNVLRRNQNIPPL